MAGRAHPTLERTAVQHTVEATALSPRPPSRAVTARLDPALTRLQRSHGNRYVQRVVAATRSADPPGAGHAANGGLVVGAANDALEREADRTADQVMRAIGSGSTATSPPSGGPGSVQRHTAAASMDAEVGFGGGPLSVDVTAGITSARGRGVPLPADLRSGMEPAFGVDLSGVRVHPGSHLAGQVASDAFTLGREIHFAPGAYRPGTRWGKRLLAHELTHVLQQQRGVATPRRIQRHASKEHYLLGALTPNEIQSLAYAKGQVTGQVDATAVAKAVKARKLKKRYRAGQAAIDPTYGEAVRVIQEQLAGLENWRRATVANPDPTHVNKGATGYARPSVAQAATAPFEHKWGGQLVTLQCRDGELVCTVGDLNALPDFFGSLDDVASVDKVIVFRTLQVIRRETYIYLKTLLAQLQGTTYAYDKAAENFSSIELNTISVANAALPEVGNAVSDLLDTETMLEGRPGEQGLPTAIGASATLGRNACHFPPESWLRWLDHHRRAREKIRSATDLNDLRQKANDAIVLNAFGEHYLQDSFAGGHLINKGYVMAQAMKHMTKATKTSRGLTKATRDLYRAATAHSAGYDVPGAAHRRMQRDTTASVLDNPQEMTARDPQTALEAARRAKAAGGLRAYAAGREEVQAFGLNPDTVDFDDYRMWLNDFWLQKITNTLHDMFCLKGLVVSSPARPQVFRAYGDSNMMRSQAGAKEAALASQMSHEAINTLVANRRNALTAAAQPGARKPLPRPVKDENAILARFPDHVKYKGHTYSLKDWATGAPMDALIASVVKSTVGVVTEGKMNALVRVASPLKSVSAGLTKDHTPF
jgi:hypothetical protein